MIGRRSLLLVVPALTILLAPAPGASAQAVDGRGTDLLVTIAARTCPGYEDITANRARNNIQESLEDLGKDTPYSDGQPVDPITEARNQPNCSPLPNWRFTLGTGIGGAVQGIWGSLSYVSNPFSTDVVTRNQVPARDDQGRRVPGVNIRGATTIELTRDQADASAGNDLWVQGGTPDDPVLDKQYPGQYGFGALRCSLDGLNGDNVETAQIPSGARHIFCYAYYVVPPPVSGTIVVRKEVRNAPDGAESFVMGGNLSYEPSGTFTLTPSGGQPAEQTFYRASTGLGDRPWTISEQVPDGWVLDDLTCTREGGSVVLADEDTGRVAIGLARGDVVTCTYTNRLRPQTGQLLLRKRTIGGLGVFPMRVRGVGRNFTATRAVRTIRQGAAAGARRPIATRPGLYRVAERTGPRFRQIALSCNGRRSTGLVRIRSGGGAVCTFTNLRRQLGAIEVDQITQGALGTSGYVVKPLPSTGRRYLKQSTTTNENVPDRATGDSTQKVPLGAYSIEQTGTVSETPGTWSLVRVVCDGRLVPFAQGRAIVVLSRRNPRKTCTFVNRLSGDTPVPPPVPVDPVTPSNVVPDLAIRKRVLQGRVRIGQVATYELTVRNAGARPAEGVVVADRPGKGASLVSAAPSQGSCGERLPLVCRLGRLEPGEQATVRVRMRMTEAGRVGNIAVVGSASRDARLANNAAVASAVRVRRAPDDPCGSSAGKRARASC